MIYTENILYQSDIAMHEI